MKKKVLLGLISSIIILISITTVAYFMMCRGPSEEKYIRLAVEFCDHAAAGYIAIHKGWFKEAGLNITGYKSYITGPALSAALGRGDVDAAYMCMIPAIIAYANAQVPLKIVAGIHKYGYSLVVNQDKVKTIEDLGKPDVRIAAPAPGTPPYVLLHKLCEKYQIDEEKILKKVQRMPAPQALLALQKGDIDAAFIPEQFPTMAEELGFKVLLTARDLWPNMQGSVLIVTDELIKNQPEVVKKLVEITRRGTQYIHENPEDAAKIVAEELQVSGKQVLPVEVAKVAEQFSVTPEIIKKSLYTRLECTMDIDPKEVQATIDYLAKLGYINKWFKAEEILDLRFMGK